MANLLLIPCITVQSDSGRIIINTLLQISSYVASTNDNAITKSETASLIASYNSDSLKIELCCLGNSLGDCLKNHRLYLMYNRGGYRHSKGRGVER